MGKNSKDLHYRPRSNVNAISYAYILPKLKKVAKSCGYALTVHGSMYRDLDIVCIPWIDGAKDSEILIKKICNAVKGFVGINMKKEYLTDKPHGRKAVIIYLDEMQKLYIDLSIMPCQK